MIPKELGKIAQYKKSSIIAHQTRVYHACFVEAFASF